jgi:hypothetical protein
VRNKLFLNMSFRNLLYWEEVPRRNQQKQKFTSRAITESPLLVLPEVVLFPDSGLGLFILMVEVSLEARAEVDMPAPEPTEERLGIPVIVSAKLTGFAGVVLGHGSSFFRVIPR